MPITIRAPRQSGQHLVGRQQQDVVRDHHTTNRPQPVAQPQAPTSPRRDGANAGPYTPHRQQYSSPATKGADDSNTDRPAKRRKLLLKGPRQQTLDSFAFTTSPAAPPPPQQQQQQQQQQQKKRHQQHSTSPPKPPSKIFVAEPHGELNETLNGVETKLDTNVDDIRSTRNTPSRVPQPATTTTTSANGKPTPTTSSKHEEKRSLRSHDEGPRLKSELAVYFPNYEEIMFDAPAEPEFITPETSIYITDDTPQHPTTKTPTTTASQAHRKTLTHGFNGCTPLDLSTLLPTQTPQKLPPTDPLTDARFEKSHRRAERKEKQLRNIERERAMHEKASLERLLDGLLGHDWLKVLGITGVTDSEARKFEKKRDHFVSEVEALVGKFRRWKEEEKRLRMIREAAREAEEEEEEEEEEASAEELSSSELNASATRQLQQETLSALKTGSSKHRNKRTPTPGSASSHQPRPKTKTSSSTKIAKDKPPHPPQHRSGLTLKLSRGNHNRPQTIPLPPAAPPSPITSFFSKSHLRAAALAHSSNSNCGGGGRHVLAFGHPLPAMPDVEEERAFQLPGEFLTPEALGASARERRARRRGRGG